MSSNHQPLARALEAICSCGVAAPLATHHWEVLQAEMDRVVRHHQQNIPSSYQEEIKFAVFERLLRSTSVLHDPARTDTMARSYLRRVTRSLLSTSPEYRHIWREKVDEGASEFLMSDQRPEAGLPERIMSELMDQPATARSVPAFLGDALGAAASEEDILTALWLHLRDTVMPLSLRKRTAKLDRERSFDEIIELIQGQTTYDTLVLKHAAGDTSKKGQQRARARIHKNHSRVRETLQNSLHKISHHPEKYPYTLSERELLNEAVSSLRVRDAPEK